jgi:hypothetical protein
MGMALRAVRAVVNASAQGQVSGSRRRRRRPLRTGQPGMVNTARRSVAVVARCRLWRAGSPTARARLWASTARVSHAAFAANSDDGR